MYQIGEKVWVIINQFDRPKEVKIINIFDRSNNSIGLQLEYLVSYKNREFNIRNIDVYPTQMDAEIFWAVTVQQEYDYTLKNQDFFLTDDYERANLIATKILSKYADEVPHILLKYL